MARHTGPKTRMSRRVGMRLFPKDEKIFTKRAFPPGMHAQGRKRVSEYAAQFLEKQKVKWMYGLLERQFRRYYEQSAKRKGDTGVMLLQMLESRLDNAVYRLGLAKTRPQARQLVSHGFFEVNGHKVNIPSYQLKVGDAISVKESKQSNKYFATQKLLIAKHQPPDWLSLEPQKLSGKVVAVPSGDPGEIGVNPQQIIEHYSR